MAKEAFKLRAEIVERSCKHNLDRGGMRRTWLRGRFERASKRYLLDVDRPQSGRLAQTDRRDTAPRRRPPGERRNGCTRLSLEEHCASLRAVLVAQMVCSSSRRMAKPPSSRYVSPSSETRSIVQCDFFNGLLVHEMAPGQRFPSPNQVDMERGPFWRAGLLPESPWEAHPVDHHRQAGRANWGIPD